MARASSDSSSSAKRARHQLGATSARAAAALCHLLPGDGGPPPFVAHTLWTASSGRRCRLCGRGCQLFGVRARCETIEVARRGDAAALEARLAARPVCRGGDAGMIVCAIAASRHVPAELLDVVHAAHPTATRSNINALAAAGRSHRVDIAEELGRLGSDGFHVSRHGVRAVDLLARAEHTDVLAATARVGVRRAPQCGSWRRASAAKLCFYVAGGRGWLRSMAALIDAGAVDCGSRDAQECALAAVFCGADVRHQPPGSSVALLQRIVDHGGHFDTRPRGYFDHNGEPWQRYMLFGMTPESIAAGAGRDIDAFRFALSHGLQVPRVAVASASLSGEVRDALEEHWAQEEEEALAV